MSIVHAGSSIRALMGGRKELAVMRATGIALMCALSLTLPSSAVADEPEYLRSFGPDGTAATNFEQIAGVAMDQQTGNVYALDGEKGAIYKFSAQGQPLDWGGGALYITGHEISGLSPYLGRNTAQIAVDSASHDIYVTEQHSVRAFQENGEPAVFTAGPGVGTSEIPGFGELWGVAVDAVGNIYAADHEAGTISVYAASGELLTSFSMTEAGNLAVASDGTVYVVSKNASSGGVYRFTPETFPPSVGITYTEGARIEPDFGLFHVGVAVDPATDDVYVIETDFGASWIMKFDAAGTFIRSFGKPGEDRELGNFAQGIAVVGGGTELQFYVGNTQEGSYSQVDIFGEEKEPPTVRSLASNVTADSAVLRALIDPGRLETKYWFEYGLEDCSTSACTAIPVGGAAIGPGSDEVAVSQGIAGLEPGTTYHYRVVAENELGVVESPDRTFTTQVLGLGFELADRRVWEMVSPPDKRGGRLLGIHKGLIQAAEDGSGLAYLSLSSVETDPDGNRSFEASTILARRGVDGWSSKDITPPHARATPIQNGDHAEYKLFSTDLSRAVFGQRDDGLLSPDASERTPYLRENSEPPVYTPLVTGKEGVANVPPGTQFGGDPNQSFGAVSIAGANADLSQVMLNSSVALSSGAPPGALYRWAAGVLTPVSVLPAGEGGTIVNGILGSGERSVRNAVSDDGSRVAWSPVTLSALYIWDGQTEGSVRLDVVQSGAGAGEPSPQFQGANTDGEVIFFTDTRQLTSDASPSGRELYRCEVPLPDSSLGCTSLSAISAPMPGSGESSEVQGVVSALSDDGDILYFVARGVLDDAPNESGASAVSGEPNLYLWSEEGGVRFIATLSDEDAPNWGGSPGGGYRVSAAASPSGRYLSFMSKRSLTGYDNSDAITGEPVQEVFRYDAEADRLECVSCNPTGSSPQGERLDVSAGAPPLVDQRGLWKGQGLAATLPEATSDNETGGNSHYRPRAVLDNGRVFFNAIDPLVPADSNAAWDVYQHEPFGVGDCTATGSGAAIARSSEGCVSLISSGTAEEESAFLDAGATGDDVFFLTTGRLSVIDKDDELDVYDARVDGVPDVLEPRAECLGEACRPPLNPLIDPTPASQAFQGPGNLKPNRAKRCLKGKRKVRRQGKTRCVARKHQRDRRANQGRRAGR